MASTWDYFCHNDKLAVIVVHPFSLDLSWDAAI